MSSSSSSWRTPTVREKGLEPTSTQKYDDRKNKIQVILNMGTSKTQNRTENNLEKKWKRFIYITLDNSDSMNGEKLTQTMSCLKKVIEDTPDHTKVVIRQFAAQLKTLVTAPAEKLDLNRLEKDVLVKKFAIGQKTALYDAWGQTVDEIPYDCYKTGRVHVLLFTDGIDTFSKTDTSLTAIKLVKDMLKKDNFFFTFVQVGSNSKGEFSMVAENLKKQCGRNPRCRVIHVEEILGEIYAANQYQHLKVFDDYHAEHKNASKPTRTEVDVDDSFIQLKISPSLEKQVGVTIIVPNSGNGSKSARTCTESNTGFPQKRKTGKMTVAERFEAQQTNTQINNHTIPSKSSTGTKTGSSHVTERIQRNFGQPRHNESERSSVPTNFARPSVGDADICRLSYVQRQVKSQRKRDDTDETTGVAVFPNSSTQTPREFRNKGVDTKKSTPESHFQSLSSRLGWDLFMGSEAVKE